MSPRPIFTALLMKFCDLGHNQCPLAIRYGECAVRIHARACGQRGLPDFLRWLILPDQVVECISLSCDAASGLAELRTGVESIRSAALAPLFTGLYRPRSDQRVGVLLCGVSATESSSPANPR